MFGILISYDVIGGGGVVVLIPGTKIVIRQGGGVQIPGKGVPVPPFLYYSLGFPRPRVLLPNLPLLENCLPGTHDLVFT